jgi:serine/threonine protein kinase
MPTKSYPTYVDRYGLRNRKIPNGAGGLLKFLNPIGEGSFGLVYLAVDTKTKDKFAIKCCEPGLSGTIEEAAQEAELNHHPLVSDHPNIVTLHILDMVGTKTGELLFAIVLDYCPGRDVLYFLEDITTVSLLRTVFWQMLDAVAHCHELGIYHRDLKMENFMCTDDPTADWRIQLSDFGASTTEPKTTFCNRGTISYVAPGTSVITHPCIMLMSL